MFSAGVFKRVVGQAPVHTPEAEQASELSEAREARHLSGLPPHTVRGESRRSSKSCHSRFLPRTNATWCDRSPLLSSTKRVSVGRRAMIVVLLMLLLSLHSGQPTLSSIGSESWQRSAKAWMLGMLVGHVQPKGGCFILKFHTGLRVQA